jgi:hypothetical protein
MRIAAGFPPCRRTGVGEIVLAECDKTDGHVLLYQLQKVARNGAYIVPCFGCDVAFSAVAKNSIVYVRTLI